LVSCEKDSSSDFSGITETDEFGLLIGSIDYTDWQTDDVWDAKEEAIFENTSISYSDLKLKSLTAVSPANEYKIVYPAYPNPSFGPIVFSFGSEVVKVSLAIVNQDFDVLMKLDLVDQNSIYFDLSSLPKNTIHRLYYILEIKDGNRLKGHGDVQILDDK
jgi:hypothetical protein